jgi:hypothetical protein
MADQIDIWSSKLKGDAYHEDIMDVIYQITPEDTPFINMIGSVGASNVYHEWSVRSLTARAHNAVAAGEEYYADTNFSNPNNPVRRANFCQILRKLPRVTRTEQRMNKIAISDSMGDEFNQKTIEWKTDLEHAALRGSLSSGPSDGTDTANIRRMGGYHNVITDGTDPTTWDDNASQAEIVFNDSMQRGWTRGAKLSTVLVGGAEKRTISSFTGSTTKYTFAEDQRITNTVGIYESDFHVTEVHLSRDVAASCVYAFDPSFFALAWFDGPFTEKLSKVADDHRGVVLGEVTLEFGNEAAAERLVGLDA